METKKKSFNFDSHMEFALKHIKMSALSMYDLDLNNTDILKFALTLMSYSFTMCENFEDLDHDLPRLTKLNLDQIFLHYFETESSDN